MVSGSQLEAEVQESKVGSRECKGGSVEVVGWIGVISALQGSK